MDVKDHADNVQCVTGVCPHMSVNSSRMCISFLSRDDELFVFCFLLASEVAGGSASVADCLLTEHCLAAALASVRVSSSVAFWRSCHDLPEGSARTRVH